MRDFEIEAEVEGRADTRLTGYQPKRPNGRRSRQQKGGRDHKTYVRERVMFDVKPVAAYDTTEELCRSQPTILLLPIDWQDAMMKLDP